MIERTSSPSASALQHFPVKRARGARLRQYCLRFGMLYRAYTRSSKFDTVKRIHTSPSSYAQKLKYVPQRAPRPPIKERAKEEVVADEPYGEYHVLSQKDCFLNGSQSSGTNLVFSCSHGTSISKSSRMLRSLPQTGHTFKLLEIISLLTALIPAKAPFCRMSPSPSLPYRARISTNIFTGSALLLPNPG